MEYNNYNLRGDKMNESNMKQNNLDFEKMNETLANPEFANWYYNKMMDKAYSDMTMQDFVQIVNDYTENQMHQYNENMCKDLSNLGYKNSIYDNTVQ